MTIPWIVVDVSSLAYRAYYTTGQMEYKGQPTGVQYGFLNELDRLEQRFGGGQFAFAFDGHPRDCKRRAKYPWYKSKPLTADQKAAKLQVYEEIKNLRDEVLPRLGYRNLFKCDGYEGDDVVANILRELEDDENAVMVSGDHDLFQLLWDYNSKITQYLPVQKCEYGERQFKDCFGISPRKWPYVKAMAGCVSDYVPGAKGVGEITAAAYLRGGMNKRLKAFKICEDWETTEQYRANVEVCTIPLEGCPPLVLRQNEPHDSAAYLRVMRSLGIREFNQAKAARRGMKRVE